MYWNSWKSMLLMPGLTSILPGTLFWVGPPGSFTTKQTKMFHNFTNRFRKGMQQGFVVCDVTHFNWYQHKHFESNQGQRSTTADHFKPSDSAISPSLKQPFQSTFNAVSIDPLQICAGHFKACFLKVLLSGTAHINTASWNRQVYLGFCRGFLMLLWNSLSIVHSGMPCLISSKVWPKMGRLWSWMMKLKMKDSRKWAAVGFCDLVWNLLPVQ